MAIALCVCAAALLPACGLDQQAVVLMTDPHYRARVVSTNRDGITVPDGLLWRHGKLFIADEGGSAVRVWNGAAGLQTLSEASGGLQSPEDLVVDDAGNIFFTDDAAGGVKQIAPDGKTTVLAGPDKGLVSTEGIALTPSGAILVGETTRHQVLRVERNGDVSVFVGPGAGIRKAESMAFDERGNLYIADNQDQVLYLLTPDMKLRRVLEKLENFSPETIWYAGGTLFITDSIAGRLSRYTPEGGLQTVAVFAGTLAKVNGVTTDDQGAICLSIQTDLKRGIGYIVKLEPEPPLAGRN
jgi:sugar lactone lactonase YvrE